MNLSGTNANLSGIALSGTVDFRGAKLGSVDFSGTDLSAAQFDSMTQLTYDDGYGQIKGANLSGTNAVLRDISGIYDFRGVNLGSVRFENSDLSQAQFDSNTIFCLLYTSPSPRD